MNNRKLTPEEMGARDGAALRDTSGPFIVEQHCAVAVACGKSFGPYVVSGRLGVEDVLSYSLEFLKAALA